MNQILYSGRAKKSHTGLIISIVAVILILIALLFTFGFGIANLSNNKILKGVIVANIDVSNMTKEEAIEAVNQLYSENSNVNLTLKYKDYAISISTDDIGFGYTDANELIEEAYAYGREGNIIDNNFTVMKSYMNEEKRIDTEEKIDAQKLEELVKEMISGDSVFTRDDTYEVSGDKLIITKGIDGERIDYAVLGDKVLEALKQRQTVVDIPVIITKSSELDLNEVYREVRRSPVNASYTEGDKFEVIAEQNGIDFDLAAAKTAYANLPSGETLEIDLIVTEPEVKLENLGDVLFKTLIATYTSDYDNSDKNRVTNLEIAANKCNNTILYPGEEFSFNQTVGNRTTANGFKKADSFADGKIVKTVGGGICQVSSTLYNAVLRAGLTVTARTAHEMYVQYVPQSTDATVVDDSIDFKFRNDRKYPVKIVTSCDDGKVTASIYGIKDENEATIEIETNIIETIEYSVINQNDSSMKIGTKKEVQKPVNGYVSEAYKVYYRNGKEVSRELISKDTYSPIDQIMKIGTKKEVVVTPEPEPVTPEPEVVPPSKRLPPGWDNPESGYGY